MFLKSWDMKSNYKRIGKYIQLVDERNSDLKVETLLGLTINKDFIPSVANTIGSDMSRYKIIRKNQFACSLMQVRRDKKIPVALQRNYKEAIISQAYPVFDVTNKDELLPEYLMMWFSRSEFDREACFYAVGGVRGSLEWEDFCNMQLPVPDIEKQKSIVKEYNTIVNRIKLNEQLNQKLEETAQAIYKQWFVEFEFPMTKEYAESIGKPELEGKAYMANGGEMVWNEVLGKNVPVGWSDGILEEIMVFNNGKKKPESKGKIPVYGGNGISDYTDEYNNEDIIAVGRVGAYCGSLFRVLNNCWVSDNAISAKSRNNFNMFCFYTLKILNLNERSVGTGQPLLTQGILNNIQSVIPIENTISKYEIISNKLFKQSNIFNIELESLKSLRITILSKTATINN
jgi:type I restriction enzyme, S subunit